MQTALEQYDPQIYELIRQEEARQSGSIRLIPSENYVSRAVMTATSSCLTNKYAEGYPGKRYYEGQQITDLIEKLAQDRAKKLFGADHANVQPYSGSVANLAAYAALIKPGERIMGYVARSRRAFDARLEGLADEQVLRISPLPGQYRYRPARFRSDSRPGQETSASGHRLRSHRVSAHH